MNFWTSVTGNKSVRSRYNPRARQSRASCGFHRGCHRDMSRCTSTCSSGPKGDVFPLLSELGLNKKAVYSKKKPNKNLWGMF